MSPSSADAVFSALADPTRRRIYSALADNGAASATALARELPVTRQAVQKHLASLEAAGLVSSMREGREIRFRPTPAPLSEAMTWMTSVGAQWDERLGALGRRMTNAGS